jgi:NADH dehydrogenase
MHRVVIIGGGAGGLELATRLGDKFASGGSASVTLIDRGRTHLWKPLLHEVAAGSMDIHAHQLDYLAQARWHHFTFALGAMQALDRDAREVVVAPVQDETGEMILPERRIGYDTLVIAIGSQCNDFGTPGVADNAFTLDGAWEANLLHRRLVNACFRANFANDHRVIRIGIIGAGATGVELAAELHNTIRVLAGYGLVNFDPEHQIRVSIIEAGPRILAGLPEYMAEATQQILTDLEIDVLCNEKVVAVTAASIETASGNSLKTDFAIWAAGIKCAEVLRDLAGLESNRINQLVVLPTLQTSRDENIFALGDCAACIWKTEDSVTRMVPPRAQSAHQQASHLVKTIQRRIHGQAPARFHYRDFGSLVSLGQYSSVGTLMGFAARGSVRVEGLMAKLFYMSLYKLHLWALHGFWRMALDTLARIIKRQTEPRVKLH